MTTIQHHIVATLIENQFGFNVSVCKYINGELVAGFTLNNFETREEQMQYAKDLGKVLALPVVNETYEGI